MKSTQFILRTKTSLLFFLLLFSTKIALSQIDTTIKPAAVKTDTIPPAVVKADTIPPATIKTDTTKSTKKKKSNRLIGYAGVTFNHLSLASTNYETNAALGWSLGVAYKRGKFFYWQVGARYNNAIYELKLAGQEPDTLTDKKFSVVDIDVPLNLGINLLSATERVVGLRLFIGAVPSFILDVSSTDFPKFTKDDVNEFMLYGQGGLGIDVLFLSIDVGYNYGFNDLFKTQESRPGQAFVHLGFRL